ncbi:MAG: ABC transporter ATP-binding protein [Thermodesulfobacteriota bacterium]
MDEGFVLENVSFCYGPKQAVCDVSLQLEPGKLYGLVGPNGCGKSTLLDLLIGNRLPQKGAVSYQGQPLADYNRRDLAREVALVPQDFGIDFAFTVLEVVLMGRHPYIPRFGSPDAADYKSADQAMAELGISGFKERIMPELSGGEKQRVVVARSLAQDTRMLLLDEATSNLDIQHTLEIFQVCRQRVAEEGRGVIAVVHNLNLAAAYCDELIFMKDGAIHCAGPKDEVLTPGNIGAVFGVEAQVQFDDFCGTSQVSFRY